MNNKEIALFAAKLLNEKKALDPVVLDVSKKSSFADYLIIAGAASERQIHALTSEVEDKLAEMGIFGKGAEGRPASGWVLLDFGDIVINVFSPEMRNRYNLEKVWGDCAPLELNLE